ncbi:DEAD/DEAH box helicase [Listeria costaricensis]|uniref:DEAD/DEAH box helicase n=1 Tax=Listeria costaricensis TaxID=2026604 RepID=UPI000C06CEAB|nr:DEAD/DEAH box helicase [Listeria costaricensis]
MNEKWKALWESHGYGNPTAIQTAIYQPILEQQNVLAIAPTGTGKTVAYTLPILEKVTSKKELQWLILAPSHELVMQIADVVRSWLTDKEITVTPLIGGANIKRQIEKLKKKPQIIVASPGRAKELIQQKKIKMHEVHTITLDECDELLSKDHFDTTLSIVQSAKRDRQLVLVSATHLETADRFFAQLSEKPLLFEEKAKPEARAQVKHQFMEVENREKPILLRRISHVAGMRGLVFVRDKARMDILLEKLAYDGVKAAGIHREIPKEMRQKVLQAFKDGTLTYLIVTDIAARGLDIPDLPYVIHYDLASNEKEYIHRSGRTGRMEKSGTVISFVNAREIRILKQYLKEQHLTGEKVRFYQGALTAETAEKKPVSKKPHQSHRSGGKRKKREK